MLFRSVRAGSGDAAAGVVVRVDHTEQRRVAGVVLLDVLDRRTAKILMVRAPVVTPAYKGALFSARFSMHPSNGNKKTVGCGLVDRHACMWQPKSWIVAHETTWHYRIAQLG